MAARNTLTSALCYRDAKAALGWLEKAFGFEPVLVLTDVAGNIAHSEMQYQGSLVMIGNEWDEATKSPASLGGKTTQTVHVQLASGIDAHCERARRAGAVILAEPSDQFYGDRTYRAGDPEGHIWTFGQTLRTVSDADMEKGSGLKVVLNKLTP